jgi:two-component system, oxyanion-binding sensor
MVKMINLTAGFLPLLDAAILIVAQENGFAAEQGLELKLVKETSWANIRDRVSVGQFDVAHMLAPLPIAQNLGLSPLHVPLIAPFALGLGGNAITVSCTVFEAMNEQSGDPTNAGSALRRLVRARKAQGLSNLMFAVVHGFSVHAYELRYWLAASGINPDLDVSITIVPPTMMSDAMASGAVDGFCVGEPWNSKAVASGLGEVITTKASIWRSSPEKVLGMRRDWAVQNAETLSKLIVALHKSASWCGDVANAGQLAAQLSKPQYLGVDADVLLKGLHGDVMRNHFQNDFLVFSERAANFPWASHALWIYSQMLRWGQLKYSPQGQRIAAESYRPDLYRAALKPLGVSLPGGSSKIEGGLLQTTIVPATSGSLALGPDGFFDGVIFDPDDVEGYLQKLSSNAALHND